MEPVALRITMESVVLCIARQAPGRYWVTMKVGENLVHSHMFFTSKAEAYSWALNFGQGRPLIFVCRYNPSSYGINLWERNEQQVDALLPEALKAADRAAMDGMPEGRSLVIMKKDLTDISQCNLRLMEKLLGQLALHESEKVINLITDSIYLYQVSNQGKGWPWSSNWRKDDDGKYVSDFGEIKYGDVALLLKKVLDERAAAGMRVNVYMDRFRASAATAAPSSTSE